MIAGIDSDSYKVSYAILGDDGNLVRCGHTSISKNKLFEDRYSAMNAELWRDILPILAGCEKVYIEEPIFIQNFGTSKNLTIVVGTIMAILEARKIKYQLVSNMRWKKVVIGKGNCSKDDIRKFAEERWGKVFELQDEMDAACVALWGVR